MPIAVTCASCGKHLKAPDRLAGKKAKCTCGAVVPIPAASASSDPGKPPAKPAGSDSTPKSPARPNLPAGKNRDDPASLQMRTGPQRIESPKLKSTPVSDDMPKFDSEGPEISFNCPDCKAPLEAGAVICTKCGFDVRTGKRLETKAEAGGGRVRAKGPGLMEQLIPILKPFVLLALIGGAVWGTYSIISFDPQKQGLDNLSKLTPGMSLQQVVDLMGAPKRKIALSLDDELQEELHTNSFTREVAYQPDFLKNMDAKWFRNGFSVTYVFSARAEHILLFDGQGKYIQYIEQKSMLAVP